MVYIDLYTCIHPSIYIHMQTDLAQRREEKERLSRQVDDLQCQVTELTRGVEEGKTSRTQLQQLLEKTDKECNHWKQKSVQQGIVIQSTQQVWS